MAFPKWARGSKPTTAACMERISTLAAELTSLNAADKTLDARRAERLIEGDVDAVRSTDSELEANSIRREVLQAQLPVLREEYHRLQGDEKAATGVRLARRYREAARTVPAAYVALADALRPVFDIRAEMLAAGLEREVRTLETPPLYAFDLGRMNGVTPALEPPEQLWTWIEAANRACAALESGR